MAQVDLTDYKNIYLKTAKEYVNNMFSSYSKLSVNLQDNEAVGVAHISSHSLKSQSQVMGFTKIVDICFEVEKAAKNILDGVVKIDDKFVFILKNAVDIVSLELVSIEKGDAEINSA
jgi:chemotaxis protein histidine kinase CheA